MNIDIQPMIEMAREREGWTVSRAEVAPPAVLDSRLWLVACDVQRENADFIAQSPRAILTLSERVAELEAQNTALQARVETLGKDEVCPVCGGTGWIQEGWGDYHMDGIPCSACEEREEGE